MPWTGVGSSGRRRHGASVRSRDGVPQKGPCVSELWQDGSGREAEGPGVIKERGSGASWDRLLVLSLWRSENAPRGSYGLRLVLSSPRPASAASPLGRFGRVSSRATSGTGIAPEGNPSESRRRKTFPESFVAAPPALPRQFRCAAGSLIEER